MGSERGQLLAERLEARQVVAADEDVDVRERGGHAAGERLVARLALEWVQPDHGVGEAVQPRGLLAEQLWIADGSSV